MEGRGGAAGRMARVEPLGKPSHRQGRARAAGLGGAGEQRVHTSLSVPIRGGRPCVWGQGSGKWCLASAAPTGARKPPGFFSRGGWGPPHMLFKK